MIKMVNTKNFVVLFGVSFQCYGTDSRIGWGFKLGDRADFQVLMELGPQKRTRPLANEDDSASRKRNVANNNRIESPLALQNVDSNVELQEESLRNTESSRNVNKALHRVESRFESKRESPGFRRWFGNLMRSMEVMKPRSGAKRPKSGPEKEENNAGKEKVAGKT